jgi:hypothetical protein
VPGGVQGLDRYAYVNNSPLVYTDPSGHSYCDSPYASIDDCNTNASNTLNQDVGWGVTDDELIEIMRLRKMGDVIAFDVQGEVNYGMFVLNENFDLVLWDMTLNQPISLRDIQDQIIGFYPYDEEEGDFDLYAGIGNSINAERQVGSTLEFRDFPLDWRLGDNSYIQFIRRDEFNCNLACGVTGVVSGGITLWEIAGYLAEYGGNPWVLGVSAVVLVVDMARNFSPTDPLVYMEPGNPPAPPTFTPPDFPDPYFNP